MPEMTGYSVGSRRSRLASFTLIELLTVMAIISILAAFMISAGIGVWNRAKRSRAAGEIQGMSTALESYKADNGIYPQASGMLTNAYAGNDGSQNGGLYQASSYILYTSLSGQVNFNTPPTAGTKSYFPFKVNQVGNLGGNTYVKDPWGYSYGYSTGDANNPQQTSPYTGSGFFDLWSTGGLTGAANANTSVWLNNWQ
jgi:general secretion pathway protein G